MQSVSPASLPALLARVPLFRRLSQTELTDLAGRARVQNFAPGSVVFERDDPGESLCVILSGLVKIYLSSAEGQEAVLVILKTGEFFGELALLDGEPRSASALAMEPTIIMSVYREQFARFIREHPDAALQMFFVISQRLRQADNVIADVAFLDLPTRVAKKLLELASNFGRKDQGEIAIDLRLRQQDFAGMVNASRESVNRVLVALSEEGLIRIDRQRITILDPLKLEDHAG